MKNIFRACVLWLLITAIPALAGTVGPSAGEGTQVPLLQTNLIGNVKSYYPEKTPFEVLGAANTVNNTRVDVTNIGASGAAAPYVFPPAGGIQMRVISTSASDGVGGTGVQTLRIHALDAAYTEITVDVTMNGVTAVLTTPTNILRINGAHSLTEGTAGSAVGSITIENTAGTVAYARIEPGYNTSRNAVFTVPAGKQLYVDHFKSASGAASGTHFTRFTMRATTHDNVLLPGVFLAHDSQSNLNGGGDTYYPIPHRFPATADIKISVISDAANANALVTAHFCGWYE